MRWGNIKKKRKKNVFPVNQGLKQDFIPFPSTKERKKEMEEEIVSNRWYDLAVEFFVFSFLFFILELNIFCQVSRLRVSFFLIPWRKRVFLRNISVSRQHDVFNFLVFLVGGGNILLRNYLIFRLLSPAHTNNY